MQRLGYPVHVESGMTISVVSGGTTAQGFLGPVPPGYCWYVEKWTAFGNHASTAPTLELFVLTSQTVPAATTATVGDRAGRQDLTLLANNAVMLSDNPIYVGENYYLVAFWSTVSQNDIMQATFQIATHQISDLHGITTEQDLAQIESHPTLVAHGHDKAV